jgi:hypothetical protein
VVDCQPIGANQPGWKLAVRLDRPQNLWGLQTCPDDWMRLADMPAGEVAIVDAHATTPKMPMLRALVAELVEPLQMELDHLRERMVQQRRNRFEVSLSHIPPEVEEKLWMRLREDVGTQALRQSREQAEKVLGAAQSAIELKITEAQEEFRHWVREQLQGVEQHRQTLSERTAEELQRRLQAATEHFQQQASVAGARLDEKGEEFLQALLQRLGQEREAHRRELEAVQTAAAGESSRLQEQLAELGRRVAELDDTARHMESGLHTRLMRTATEIVTGARAQLDKAADQLFEGLATRNAKDLGQHLDEAKAQLSNIHNEIENSLSEAMKASVSTTLHSFEKTVDDSAQRSVERWRIALARDLDAIAKTLGRHFGAQAEADPDQRQ